MASSTSVLLGTSLPQIRGSLATVGGGSGFLGTNVASAPLTPHYRELGEGLSLLFDSNSLFSPQGILFLVRKMLFLYLNLAPQ